jgi:hypothetical protein
VTPGARPRWATTWLLVVAGFVGFAAPAAADPAAEILQQVYLTPATSGLTVQLDLTPGVLVAPQFARSVDRDGDGALISSAAMTTPAAASAWV